jgi:PIN domain nuclease of toxin-antitoxin system
MHLILDTHVLIWFINGEKALPISLRKLISNTENTCYVSIASIWEMALKSSLGKLKLKIDFNKIAVLLQENDIAILPINIEHIEKLLELEYNHRDPFDRIILAQGITEGFTIISKDKHFKGYKADLLWKK